MEKESCREMEAKEAYILMKQEYRISRNIRASWFFGNLNKYISITNPDELLESSEELEVLSVLPKNPSQQPHPYSPGCQCKFKLVPSTHVTFLAWRYRFVVVLDLSPSMATVDIQSGRISLLDIYTCLSKCLRGLTRPFNVPGSRLVIAPKIYVTVIAYTPLASLTTQQVMVQGCLLTTDNLDVFLEKLQEQLDEYENKIVNNMFAGLPSDDEDQDAVLQGPSGPSVTTGGNVKTDATQKDKAKLLEPEIASPEAGFVNMLWCGILALQLLPENTSAGIIVVTDGVTAMPDAATTNALLTQMRSSTIACSFLQVGKGFHPHCSFGYIPHTEIMQFLATATFGAFLSKCTDVDISPANAMNQYHNAFLSWHFQKGLDGMKIDHNKRHQHHVISSESGWSSEGIQPSFTVNQHGACTIPLITKKHMDVTLHTSLSNVLSVRLREGYTIKEVSITKNETQIEVKLALPWKYNGRIEYKATSLWPLNQNSRITAVEVIMEGSYEFLRDVTCPQRGPQNTYRAKVVRNFWNTLKNLRDTDQLLVHLQSFATNPIYYTVPEGTRKGMPLFYMPPNSDTPVLAQKLDKKDSSVVQFAEFWKRITLMDSKRWQRWLHTHRLALLLVPDLPLPKYLYLPSSNGRYNSIQCRMALKELNSILRDISTFILLENHSYITLMQEDPKAAPTSFYLVRVTSKAPGVVIRLGFLGGTPGHVRNKIVKELKEKLEGLSITQKLTLMQESGFALRLISRTAQQQQQQGFFARPCVILLSRPMDMILVKYEKMPADFTDLKTSIQVTVASVPVYMHNHTPDKTLNRLACYLHHQRWIWDAQSDSNTPISPQAVANVLSLLTKIRLQEGFHFAYSNSGIISFVTEIHMRNPMQLSITDTDQDEKDKEQGFFPCFVQYILFPPHTTTFVRERLTSGSEHWGSDLIDDSDTAEADGRLQLVTECWIEPQSGTVYDLPPEQKHFHNATYKEIPSLMYPIDHEVITTLLTYEHLKAHCSNLVYSNSPLNALRASPSKVSNLQFSESISHIPFQLDLMKLVSKSQQVEILCSTYLEDPTEAEAEGDAHEAENQRRQFTEPKPNDNLFGLLLDGLKQMSNHEVLLTPGESLEFAKAVLSRDRRDHTAPFVLPERELEEMEQYVRRQNPSADNGTNSHLNDSHSSFNPESSGHKFEDQRSCPGPENQQTCPVPQWTCFVHNVESASSQLMLVFLPATFRDLQKLMEIHEEPEAGEEPEKAKESKDLKDAAEGAESDLHMEFAPAESQKETEGAEGTDVMTVGVEGKEESMDDRSDVNKVDQEEKNEAEARPGEEPDANPEEQPPPKSVVLPIYVYDCSMVGLKTYLLDPNPHIKYSDIFDDKTFSRLYADGKNGRGAFSRQHSRTQSTSAMYEELHKSAHMPEVEQDNRKTCSKTLERFHIRLVHEIQKRFGLGIYQSLQKGQYISSQDIQSAMEEICEEASCEIDITEFVLSVCEHAMESNRQVAVEDDSIDQLGDDKDLPYTQASAESTPQDKDDEAESASRDDNTESSEALTEDDSPRLRFSADEERGASFSIPLSCLDDASKCDAIIDLHQVIQQHFQKIMGKHFKPIPTNKDFWYFCVEGEEPGHEVGNPEMEDSSKDTDTAAAESDNVMLTTIKTRESSTLSEEDMDLPNVSSDDDDDDDTWKAGRGNKINSVVGAYQSRRSDDDDYSMSEGGRTSNESIMGSVEDQGNAPLFINLVCEIKVKTNAEYKTVQTIPTCLSSLISFLKKTPGDILDLSELSVTLDLMSLTLPPDLTLEDTDWDEPDRSREISLTEHSPPASPVRPTDDPFGSHDRRQTMVSEVGFGNLTMADVLDNLPVTQKEAIHETADDIRWLLKDEIASARCHIFPPTVETLEMVAEHVKQSLGKPSCIAEDVELQFVFGPEQSLEKFQEQFEGLDIPNYQLNKVGDYYHVKIDQVERNETLPDKESLHIALKSLGQMEPHRLLDKSEVLVPSQASSKSSTMVICTPPSPVKEAKYEGVEDEEDVSKSDSYESSSKNESLASEKKPSDFDDKKGTSAGTDTKGVEEDKLVSDQKDEKAQGAEVGDDTAMPIENTEPRPDDDRRSSGSSIQILSEDHFGDGKHDVADIGDVAEEGLSSTTQVVSTAEDTCSSTTKEESKTAMESDENPLRRNSASFIVLSKDSQDKDEKEDQSPDSAEEAVEAVQSADVALDEKDHDQQGSTDQQQKKEEDVSLDEPATIITIPSRSTSSSSAPDASFVDGSTSARESSSNTSVFKQDNELAAVYSPRRHSSEGEFSSHKSKLRHTSGISTARSSASGPPSSQMSYASLNGSFNEYDDGYEACSSDNDAEESCDKSVTPLVKKVGGMPHFWLIMKVDSDKVEVFFHARSKGNQDQEFSEKKEVYDRVTENIRNICRQVNQKLLLQDLHETRICKPLLVDPSDDEVWKGDDHSKGRNYKLSNESEYDEVDGEPKDYLAAAMAFSPGHFACDEIWYTHLPVHSRLKSSHRSGTASRGLQSVKTTLTAFEVANRKNMFVYKSNTGDVYYLKLSESTILNYDSSRHGSIAEGARLTGGELSRTTSIQSLNTTVGSIGVFDEDHGSLDTTSKRSFITDAGVDTLVGSIKGTSGHYRSDHCIKLTVHGIAGPGQPSPEIQEELVQVLRNRLDDTTLDVISATLARNPMLKLTHDDIQFIQPCGKGPTETLRCTIPQSATKYLFSVNYYLRQNLRQFLNPPKYIDGRSENHFKAKCDSHEHTDAAHTSNNVFLCNRPHESGRTGIACISLCIIDTKGAPIRRTFSRPSPITYVDYIEESDFVEYTRSEKLISTDTEATAEAMIEFAIWERGDVNLEQLTDSLIKAVQYTFCDIVMEFRILTAPLGIYVKSSDDSPTEVEVPKKPDTDPFTDQVQMSGSSSPRTPIQGAMSLFGLDRERNPSGSIKTQLSYPKVLSPTSAKSKPTWQEHELERRNNEMARQKSKEAAIGQHGTMHPVFSKVCLPWMNYEHHLGVPSIQKMTAELSSRFSVEFVLRELLTKIPTLCTDFTTKLYKEISQEYKLCNLNKPTSECSQKPLPGAMQNYFLIARNVQHWDCSLDYPSAEDFASVYNLENPVTRKGLQQFPPLVLSPRSKSATPEAEQEGVMELGTQLLQHPKKFVVPRQHLLLVFISDRRMTFFTYNINGELQSGLENLFKGLVTWQNSRSDLLKCILSQKMGLFHNHKDVNWSLEEIDMLIKCKTPQAKERKISTVKISTVHKPTRRLLPGLPPFEETLRNKKILKPLQQCSYGQLKDPVQRHGTQVLNICFLSKKEAEVQMKLEHLYIMWQKKKRGSYVRHPISVETLELLKQSSQVFHYCATPLLFVPNWKKKITNDCWLDEDAYGDVTAEPWLMDIRTSFVQQYVQFLKTLQFSPVELTMSSPRQRLKNVSKVKDGKVEVVPNRKHGTTSSGCHLQLTVPGGIILIEIAFQNAYFCVKLYAFESSKVPAGKAVNPQLSMLFTDECDKFKDQIHLHSFSYDFHLRTIQNYLHAPEMGFKPRYHVTNFLADLVNYYSPSPNFRRNHIHVESQAFLSHNTPASLLYKYLMTNKPPHMKQMSMASGMETSDKELEHALYQIYPLSGYFKDAQGSSQYDEFHVSLVLTWDKEEHKSHSRPTSMLLEPDQATTPDASAADARNNPNLMKLKFYVIVTSRKELFPRRTIVRPFHSTTVMFKTDSYFKDNSHGFQLLNTEAQNAKEKIVTMVKQAADDCRRDTLWQQLLIWDTDEDLTEKKKKKKDSSTDEPTETTQLTYPEFKVLLDHVNHIPFSEFDQQIVPLLNSSIQWYEGLLQYLRSKFITASRYLTSEDRQIKHLALLNPSHLDMMVLLTVDQQTNTMELEAIFKKSASQLHAAARSQEYLSAQDLYTQRHVESIVNAVSCYLWTTLL